MTTYTINIVIFSLAPNIRLTTPLREPAGYVRAKNISECYSIQELNETEQVYTYEVGGNAHADIRTIKITNKTHDNPIFVQLFLPVFLEIISGSAETVIQPRSFKQVEMAVSELGALSVVHQKRYRYSEPMDIYVNILDVNGPVYIPMGT